MSTGRQGSQLEPQQLHLEAAAPGAAAAAALTPAQKRSSRARSSRVERLRLALGDAADAERAHQPVDRQPLRPGHLARPGRATARR